MNRNARVHLALAALAAAAACIPVAAAGQDATAPAPHEVRRGDTLWDLAARYLADPFLWPEIFRLNPDVVEDPDRIFPGELLRIPGRDGTVAGRPATAARGGEGRERSPRRAEDALNARTRGGGDLAGTVFQTRNERLSASGALAVAERPPSSLISRSDFYRVGRVLSVLELGPSGTTLRTVERTALSLELPTSARPHQEVWIAAGDLHPSPGDLLQAVRWGRSIGDRARLLSSMALLEVTGARGDSIRARVVELYGGYQAGDPVIAAELFELDPAARPVEADLPLTATLLAFETPQRLLGPNDAVILDAGASDGIRMGDEFLVFGHDVSNPATELPRDALLRVRVVRTTDRTATAIVDGVLAPGVREGSPVLLVARLPAAG